MRIYVFFMNLQIIYLEVADYDLDIWDHDLYMYDEPSHKRITDGSHISSSKTFLTIGYQMSIKLYTYSKTVDKGFEFIWRSGKVLEESMIIG